MKKGLRQLHECEYGEDSYDNHGLNHCPDEKGIATAEVFYQESIDTVPFSLNHCPDEKGIATKIFEVEYPIASAQKNF